LGAEIENQYFGVHVRGLRDNSENSASRESKLKTKWLSPSLKNKVVVPLF
jgi:hypothetical protein